MDQFLCWKLKVATVAVCGWVCASAGLGALFELLDVIALADSNFEIKGSFQSQWRSHVWEGWLATNLVMFFCHLIMIGCSILIIFAVRVFPTYYEYHLTKGYLAFFIIYILVELGIGCYRYSWYGENTFRLPFLIWCFLYWLTRSIINIVCCLIVYSRIAEIDYEIMYGEKKVFNAYSASANLLDVTMRSGTATPIQPGMRTLQGYQPSQSFA